MTRKIIVASAVTLGMAIALFCAPASAKTAKECNTEYAANKAAIRGGGQKKADFIAACKAGTKKDPDKRRPRCRRAGGFSSCSLCSCARRETHTARTGFRF